MREKQDMPDEKMPAETLKPCPFCGCDMNRAEHTAFHANNECWLNNIELDELYYASWNTRSLLPEGERR